MFIGQYLHTLEVKGRLAIPRDFRSPLGRQAVITKGLDGCLFLFPLETWSSFSQKINQMSVTKKDSRAFSRFLTFAAAKVSLDSQGRILIPDHLRQFAGLKKHVMVAGASSRVEVWDKKRFDQYQGQIEKETEKITERLTDVGF